MAKRKSAAPDKTLADRPSVDGRRPIRKLRHWKQQFDQDARFLWRRDVHWDEDTDFKRGDLVPDGLINRTKLRRFWESGWIELLDFSEPTNVLTGSTEPVIEPGPVSSNETTLSGRETSPDAEESSESSDNPKGDVAPPLDAESDESDESDAPIASD